MISAWSSGTGAAGVVGAGSYALLTAAGLRPQLTVLVMLCVPCGLALAFWRLLEPSSAPDTDTTTEYTALAQSEVHDESSASDQEFQEATNPGRQLSLQDKADVVKGLLLKYMLPLGAVYFSEYLINQGLFELLYFPGVSLSHAQQYRWYQLTYQLGVLVSRSSLLCLSISRIYVLSILQVSL